jgi:quercetin dioxygenase-like cupin family protein
VLSAGDSLLFDATQPHCWKNQNKKPSVVILVFQTAQSDLSARQQHMKTEPQSTDYE